MNPRDQFCPTQRCPLRGKIGFGNVVIHSQAERRYRCKGCGHTFAETKGTPYYRLRTQETTVTCVVTLLAYGCPPQAIVAAFGLDERTVADWQRRAGEHCERFHEAVVCQGKVDLGCVQADELWVKLVGGKRWLALALAVPSRLFLGAQLAPERELGLIAALVKQVRRCAKELGILVLVDGLASYPKAFRSLFRVPQHSGGRGRPPRVMAAGFLLGQVIKRAVKCRTVDVAHQAVCGSLEEVEARIAATGAGQVINTAYVERFNATLRSRIVGLIRRGRCLARTQRLVRAGVYLVGGVYNFCCFHDGLRQRAPTDRGNKWRPQTPAMASGLTDQLWSVAALLHFKVAPKPWTMPPRRTYGRETRRTTLGVQPWKLRRRTPVWSSTV